MGRISAYESSDGQLFKDRAAYISHERNLVAGARMRKLIESQVSDPVLAKAVGDFYAANAGALRDILTSKDITIEGGQADEEVPAPAEPTQPAEPVQPDEPGTPVEPAGAI